MTDRNDILRACEDRIGDLTQLLVAADWFAENDEPDMERALRWMSKWEKWPLPNYSRDHGNVMHWTWTCYGGLCGPKFNCGVNHALPRAICKRMYFWEFRCYADWEDAVTGLGMALADGDIACVGDPTKCEPASVVEAAEGLIRQMRMGK